MKGLAWVIDKMGHILGANFSLLVPLSGQMIHNCTNIITFNLKSTVIYVLGKILSKEKAKKTDRDFGGVEEGK